MVPQNCVIYCILVFPILTSLVQAEDDKLAYEGKTTFYADKPPKGFTQSSVYSDQESHPIEIEITWKA